MTLAFRSRGHSGVCGPEAPRPCGQQGGDGYGSKWGPHLFIECLLCARQWLGGSKDTVLVKVRSVSCTRGTLQ